MRTLLESDAVVFGTYDFGEWDSECRLLTRLELPEDATSLSDGKYSLQLYAKATQDFYGYERVEIGPPIEFKLPHRTRALIGVEFPSHTSVEIPETIITRDGRIFLEQSEIDKKDPEELQREFRVARDHFKHKSYPIHERWMLERIKREGFPVITEA